MGIMLATLLHCGVLGVSLSCCPVARRLIARLVYISVHLDVVGHVNSGWGCCRNCIAGEHLATLEQLGGCSVQQVSLLWRGTWSTSRAAELACCVAQQAAPTPKSQWGGGSSATGSQCLGAVAMCKQVASLCSSGSCKLCRTDEYQHAYSVKDRVRAGASTSRPIMIELYAAGAVRVVVHTSLCPYGPTAWGRC